MTSISITTRELGNVSCCPVPAEDDLHAVLITSHFDKVMRLTLTAAGCLELGEALVQISKDLGGGTVL
jgi:hypothetical protein